MNVALCAEDEPVGTRAEYWRHVVETTIAPMALRIGGSRDFRSRIHSGQVGPVQVTELVVPPAELIRSDKLARRDDLEMCKIDVQVAGTMVVEQGGSQAVLRPGDFTMVDLSRPCRWTNTPGSVVAVAFPKAMLPIRSDDAVRIVGQRIAGGEKTAALVTALAAQLVEHIGNRDDGRLGTALLDLLAVTLTDRLGQTTTSATSPETGKRALLLRVQTFIEERLGDPELTPQRVADAHHVSLRYLYGLFETQHESVAASIRRRRLERCRRQLEDPACVDPVSTVGARWGFTSADHFSRVFRSAYGLSPREYRQVLRRPGS